MPLYKGTKEGEKQKGKGRTGMEDFLVSSSSTSATPIWQQNGVELQRTRARRKLELAAWRMELTGAWVSSGKLF